MGLEVEINRQAVELAQHVELYREFIVTPMQQGQKTPATLITKKKSIKALSDDYVMITLGNGEREGHIAIDFFGHIPVENLKISESLKVITQTIAYHSKSLEIEHYIEQTGRSLLSRGLKPGLVMKGDYSLQQFPSIKNLVEHALDRIDKATLRSTFFP